MSDETGGTQKISMKELKEGKDTTPDEGDLTGEEIERIADLFADKSEEDQDTGEFDPIKGDSAE